MQRHFSTLGDSGAVSLLQFAFYPLALVLAAMFISRSNGTTLRADSLRVSSMNAFFIRAAFWGVVLVGLADLAISFLRVEDLLSGVVGEQLSKDLGRSHFRRTLCSYPVIDTWCCDGEVYAHLGVSLVGADRLLWLS